MGKCKICEYKNMKNTKNRDIMISLHKGVENSKKSKNV